MYVDQDDQDALHVVLRRSYAVSAVGKWGRKKVAQAYPPPPIGVAAVQPPPPPYPPPSAAPVAVDPATALASASSTAGPTLNKIKVDDLEEFQESVTALEESTREIMKALTILRSYKRG